MKQEFNMFFYHKKTWLNHRYFRKYSTISGARYQSSIFKILIVLILSYVINDVKILTRVCFYLLCYSLIVSWFWPAPLPARWRMAYRPRRRWLTPCWRYCGSSASCVDSRKSHFVRPTSSFSPHQTWERSPAVWLTVSPMPGDHRVDLLLIWNTTKDNVKQ